MSKIVKSARDLTVEEQLARGPMDLPFLMLTLLLTGIGLIMMFSASYASAYYESGNPTLYVVKQSVLGAAGIVSMIVISKINYQTFRWMSVFALWGSIVLLFAVHIPGIGLAQGDALRWIRLGPTQFQPSELTKLGVILYFSARLSKRGSEKKKKKAPPRGALRRFSVWLERIGFFELLPYGGILLIIIVAMYFQNHMSGTILIIVVAASVLFAGGVKLGWFVAGGSLVTAILSFIIANTTYMKSRIDIWLNPWSDPVGKGFQAIQSLLAIGSGGLLGLGLGNSRQKFLYLPEEHNDFIFAIVCEELGFIGAALVIILFALLILRGYWLAIHARDRFGALLIVGITTMFAFQVFFNISVVTGLLPVTGISLPFFSYGGTALVIQMAEMGIVLSVSRQIPAPRAD